MDYLGSQMSSLRDRKLLNGFDYLIGAICIHSQQSCQPIGISCPDQSHWFPWTSRHSFDLLELRSTNLKRTLSDHAVAQKSLHLSRSVYQ